MEDTIRDTIQLSTSTTERLNPCFNGRYYQRVMLQRKIKSNLVLILVLMEDTIRGLGVFNRDTRSVSLNPCFNGRYYQS